MTLSAAEVLDKAVVRSTILSAYRVAMEDFHLGCTECDRDTASGRIQALRDLAVDLGLDPLVLV